MELLWREKGDPKRVSRRLPRARCARMPFPHVHRSTGIPRPKRSGSADTCRSLLSRDLSCLLRHVRGQLGDVVC
eukprot:scaffold259_cov252-Pinguiococcus_pyrenoidosus.AAC.2